MISCYRAPSSTQNQDGFLPRNSSPRKEPSIHQDPKELNPTAHSLKQWLQVVLAFRRRQDCTPRNPAQAISRILCEVMLRKSESAGLLQPATAAREPICITREVSNRGAAAQKAPEKAFYCAGQFPCIGRARKITQEKKNNKKKTKTKPKFSPCT